MGGKDLLGSIKALTTLVGVSQGVQKIVEGQAELTQAAERGDVDAVKAAMEKIKEGEVIAEHFSDKPKARK